MAKYSVIIATHDRPALLKRALRSVKEQSFRDVSVIIVSDMRSPETYDAVKDMLSGDDVYVERGGPAGPAPSRNLGLKVAESAYVMFLDDDDELSADFLAKADPLINGASDTIFFTDFLVTFDGLDRTGDPTSPLAASSIGSRNPLEVHINNFIPNSALIYPAAAVAGKQYDHALVLNEDWEFLLNALQGYRLAHLPVHGPIIHKTDRARGDRRGAVNDHLLLQVFLQIYGKRPAPTPEIRAARQAFFASCGIDLPLDVF